MTIEEFLKVDGNFNEAVFINRVDNTFIKLFTAIMLDELDDVKHFISDELYDYYKKKNEEMNLNNQRQMYDELNVKSSRINNIFINEDNYIIEVYLEARYMDYIIDLESGNKISGNDESRVQDNYILQFVRKVDIKQQGMVRRCPGCGAPMDINNNGKCSYCGATYNLEDYDWILNSIKKDSF